jgi:hypothetical protein
MTQKKGGSADSAAAPYKNISPHKKTDKLGSTDRRKELQTITKDFQPVERRHDE